MEFGKAWNLKINKGKGLVCQKNTEVVITEFQDKFFIIATEYEKIGVMVEVTQTVLPETENHVLNSRVLFGNDVPEVHAAGCSLVKLLNLKKPTIFGFAFKKYSEATVSDLKDIISNCLRQNVVES